MKPGQVIAVDLSGCFPWGKPLLVQKLRRQPGVLQPTANRVGHATRTAEVHVTLRQIGHDSQQP
jgi:hypothetical protein